ncbi:hypothetical protein [Paracoccus benzoatiresistens]|uniref:Uncharacterized protein n=1 Tax=Paracoccus benzoatiresistens TaxID=2997341 RepID=A0ABT4J4B0_9RHOB|nr:hypothetical protein [Paracoccus sp. EF6]MCZ0961922.1 hypothetical protein [Paracoccus sp. EF6]
MTIQSQQIGASSPPLYSVRLIDRRTGQVHRVNGAPLLALSREPEAAAASLLEGRDPALWEARIEPLATRTHQ